MRERVPAKTDALKMPGRGQAREPRLTRDGVLDAAKWTHRNTKADKMPRDENEDGGAKRMMKVDARKEIAQKQPGYRQCAGLWSLCRIASNQEDLQMATIGAGKETVEEKWR